MRAIVDVLTLTEGTVVAGRYRIVREIGRGAIGVVYAVEHLNTGVRFAMKLMLDASARPATDRADRFRRESRASARVMSEHVVKVMEADTAIELGGAPFLVMELLEGRDLEKTLEAHSKLEPIEVIHILVQVGRALDVAHAAGVIHRDLKPENIFLHRRDDDVLVVKVLDFGISKMLGRDSDMRLASVAVSSDVIGTPLYMAPEQATARHGDVSPPTDVWAVGLLAVRMLTGRHYWHAESITELIIQILNDERTPPSAKFPELAPAFDAWFLKSCALDPSERFQSVGAQVSALAVALVGERPVVQDHAGAEARA